MNTNRCYRIRRNADHLYLAVTSSLTGFGGQLHWTPRRSDALVLDRTAAQLATGQAAVVLGFTEDHGQVEAVPVRGGWPQFASAA